MFLKSLRLKHSIKKLVKGNPNQLSKSEYAYLAKVILKRRKCQMLVFGVGKDSHLWMNVNRKGETIFLEDSISWFAQIRTENPKIKGYLIKYNSRLGEWEELLNKPSNRLMLTLPDQVGKREWDVVLVDAPAGYNKSTPGRMQSIYTTSVLSEKSENIDIFVHDCDREVEKVYCDRFFSNMQLVMAFDRLRYYEKALS
jgi:glucuronoxylan 4-O-methyltransferase